MTSPAPALRKAIFITGAASGIGRATAQHFANKGWLVGLADMNRDGLAETHAMLPAGHGSVHPLDVRDRAAWTTALADFVAISGGRLDVLFNNAGVARSGLFGDVTTADHDLLIDVNVKGVIYGAEAGFPHLRSTPGSCLLNTCSAAGMVAGPMMAVYSVTKFGVRALTEALEIEWRPHGIKVCSLMPGFIDTPLLETGMAGTNYNVRDTVNDVGLEISPVSIVADAAWAAIHGKQTHVMVGKSAKRLKFLTRWLPGLVRRGMNRPAAERAHP